MPPKVNVELEPWVRAIIHETIAEHIKDCPLGERVRRLELSWSKAVGMCVGAGMVGGLVMKLLVRM